MKKDVKNNLRNDAEPSIRAGAVYLPMWLTGLLGLLLYWSCAHIDNNSGNFSELVYAPYRSTNELAGARPVGDDGGFAKGKMIYEGPYCSACHQASGLGSAGLAPPLAGSEWVLTANPERMIRIAQTGLTGPITVKGQQWNLTMTPIGATLKDDELAAVLTYVRNAWGNKAPKVTVDDVKKVRAALADRTDPHTADELIKVPAE